MATLVGLEPRFSGVNYVDAPATFFRSDFAWIYLFDFRATYHCSPCQCHPPHLHRLRDRLLISGFWIRPVGFGLGWTVIANRSSWANQRRHLESKLKKLRRTKNKGSAISRNRRVVRQKHYPTYIILAKFPKRKMFYFKIINRLKVNLMFAMGQQVWLQILKE